MRKFRVLASLLITTTLLLAACNFPRPTATPLAGGESSIQTVAAMTVEALLTSDAPTGTTAAPEASLTPMPTNTPNPSEPTPTATITATPQNTNTPETPCDRAAFVGESIPDGTEISADGQFTKVWTLKNNGTCTWNSSYSLVFVKGSAMTSVASKQLTSGTVAPGETIQIPIDLTAPSTAGTYRGDWMLRNSSGVLFGLGDAADETFWVSIKDTGSKISFFIDNMCSAQWSSSAGDLPCPGKSKDAKGFVIRQDAPKLQNNTTDNEPALWTNPQATNGGYIAGKYPATTINNGQHFKSVIGCLYDAKNCDVKFSLIYSADGGADQVLQEWNQTYSGNITSVDLDLSSLAGKSVVFTLKVTVNSGADQAQAFWLKPRLEP